MYKGALFRAQIAPVTNIMITVRAFFCIIDIYFFFAIPAMYLPISGFITLVFS